jgi:hypothetical protein
MLTPAERAAARAFRAAQRAALAAADEKDPPGMSVSVFTRYVRHECAASGGRSVFLELREHYALSPEYGILGYTPDDFEALEHEDGQAYPEPCAAIVPAKRFGWIWTQGKCPACGMTARSSAGRLVDPGIRLPGEHAILA